LVGGRLNDAAAARLNKRWEACDCRRQSSAGSSENEGSASLAHPGEVRRSGARPADSKNLAAAEKEGVAAS
jgi:hypothetical protein